MTTDLRTAFDDDAERYNRYRPQYPDELFSKLADETTLTQESKLLEIGPGTGQATKSLAKLGCDITGVELGVGLADKARVELAEFPNVHIVTGAFEDVELPRLHYDLIFSATAFHWVNDEHKFTKTAALLKPHGYLAIVHTEHISDERGDVFTVAAQPIYDKYWRPKKAGSFRLPRVDDLKPFFIDKSYFKLKNLAVFPVTITYSAKDYAGLLSTYSPTIALSPTERHSFLKAVEELIDKKFSGSIKKRLAFTLTIAQKK